MSRSYLSLLVGTKPLSWTFSHNPNPSDSSPLIMGPLQLIASHSAKSIISLSCVNCATSINQLITHKTSHVLEQVTCMKPITHNLSYV